MSKLPRHSDIDSQLWLDNVNPLALAWRLGCIASVLTVVVSWLVLIGLGSTGWVDLSFWYFVTLPIGAWLVLLAVPILLKTRRGALRIFDAIATTAEAYLSRAGYSIDLNNDSYIGHVQPIQIEPPQTQVITPMVLSGPQGVKLLARDATAIPDVANQPAEPDPAPAPPITRRVWDLPGGIKCPQETVETFVERIFIIGWGRGEWVGPGKPLERDVYDALINLLVQAQIIEGRKAGHAGKLTIDDPATAKRILNLV